MALFFQIVGILLVIIFGTISAIQTRRANAFARQVANSQGAFRRTDLSINLFNRERISHFLIALPLKRKVFEIPLQLTVNNRGDKSIDEPEIFLRANKILFFGGGAEYLAESANPKGIKVSRASETDQMITLAFVSDKNLHPKQPVNIIVPMSIKSSTIFRSKADATSKDGVDFIVTYWANVSFIVDVIIAQKNQVPMSKRFAISVIDISEKTTNNYIGEYNKALTKNYADRKKRLRYQECLET